MFKRLYWLFSYLGVMTLSAAFLMGFRYEPGAPVENAIFGLVLFGVESPRAATPS